MINVILSNGLAARKQKKIIKHIKSLTVVSARKEECIVSLRQESRESVSSCLRGMKDRQWERQYTDS